jgi:hypothetical protein
MIKELNKCNFEVVDELNYMGEWKIHRSCRFGQDTALSPVGNPVAAVVDGNVQNMVCFLHIPVKYPTIS